MKPLVSVCVQTYNHVKYIKDCLDSILQQQTTFDFELLLGEDGSSDGTREICIEYAQRYPDKIRLFLNSRENVIYIEGCPTGRWNITNNIKNSKGKYIAFCEGDDYWADPKKLQKQIEFLEKNPDYVICLHNSTIKFEDSDQQDKIAIVDPKEELSLKDFIDVDYFRRKKGLISRGHTSSIVLRNFLLQEFPDWFYSKSLSADIYLQMLIAQYGRGKFINECMSVYRVNNGGITRVNPAHRGHSINQNRILILHDLNKQCNYKFNKLIRSQIKQFHFKEAKLYEQENQLNKMRKHILLGLSFSDQKLASLKTVLQIVGNRFKVLLVILKAYTKVKLIIKRMLLVRNAV